MKRTKRLMVVVVVAVVFVLLGLTSVVAWAHNAGHVHVPSGECINVGAGNEVILPNGEKLDLIPGEGDQFGARYAAEQGKTPVYPRHCDEPGAHNHP